MRRLSALILAGLLAWTPLAHAGSLTTPASAIVLQANTWSALQTFSAGLTVSGGNLIAPTIIGGTGTTSTLTLQSTSGVGTTGADIVFKVGNNGSVEAGRFYNNGQLKLKDGTAAAPAFTTVTNDQTGFYAIAGGVWGFSSGGTTAVRIGSSIDYSNTATLAWSIDGSPSSTKDVVLSRFGTNALALSGPAGQGVSFVLNGSNGQSYTLGRATELVAVGSGLTTKETTIQIPADAIVYAVPVRVKTQPGGTSTVTVTATTSGTAFQKGASISTAATTTDPGTKNTPVNYNSVAAQTVTLTFDAPTSDAAGEVRIDIYYATATPPTS